jgi:hypothetical protein
MANARRLDNASDETKLPDKCGCDCGTALCTLDSCAAAVAAAIATSVWFLRNDREELEGMTRLDAGVGADKAVSAKDDAMARAMASTPSALP